MPRAHGQAQASVAERRPRDIGEYKAWLGTRFKTNVTSRYPTYYATVASEMVRQLGASGFWRNLVARLQSIDDQYRVARGVGLRTSDPPVLVAKPWSSFLDKTYRLNVLANHRWPEPPEDGWLTPEDWLGRIGDIVRTTLYVRYLDGVEFLADHVRRVAEDCGCGCVVEYQPGDDGYYALHLDVDAEFEIPRREWDTMRLKTTVELQITTGVKGLIKELLEERYRKTRLEAPSAAPAKPIAWMLGTDAFSLSYLGHVTHYIEETIVRLRDKKEGGA